MSTISERLGLDLPIIQAPMAGSQGSALAIAVSEAGALGSMPAALLDPDKLEAELRTITAATSRPYNVNFFCHRMPEVDGARDAAWRETLRPYYRELELDPDLAPAGPVRRPFDAASAAVLEAFRPKVVSFHFGLPPADLLARARSWGAVILSSATTVDEAIWLERQGVDAIIAQGSEAGGHRGMFLTDDLATQVGTFALISGVVRAVSLPVIAAGGIADRTGVRAAMALGASAVQVGTAYLFCPEATTSPLHRAALDSPAAGATVITNVMTGRPARGIVNRLIREAGPISAVAPPFPLAADRVAPLRAAAEKRGSGDFTSMWAGQNAGGCRPMAAAALTRELAAGL